MSGTLNMPPRVTMAQAPVRPLPVRIRLFPDETTRSLLRRLETANALHRGELKKTLRATRKPWIETISEWSGDSPERLTFAMPQLGSKNRVILDHDKLTGRPDRHTSGTACHRCSLAHGAGQYVEIYTTHERVLCPRHGLWIGDGAPQPTDQLSIRACPVIDAAWHHHINLIERRGHARMRTAFYISGVINWRWYDQFLHFTHTTDIYETLAADQPRHARSQAIVAASLYPATVELAAAIASPYWADIAHLSLIHI